MRKCRRLIALLVASFAACSSDVPETANSVPLPAPGWQSSADLPEQTRLDEASVCTTCIVLDSVVVLGGELDGPRAIDRGVSDVAVDALGRFWLGQVESILVLSESGEVISRVGRGGEGPLEFSEPRPVFGDESGNVVVHDRGNSRVSVIGSDFTLLRDFPFSSSLRDMARVSDSVFFANTSTIGSVPFQIVVNDSVGGQFGSVPQTPEDDMFAFGPVAADTAGTLYWSSQYELDVSVRDFSGTPLTRFVDPTFNVPRVRLGVFTTENPPPNRIVDLRLDDDGFLWVLKSVRQDNWQDGMISSGPDGRLGFLDGDSGNAYDTEVDVIDPSRGTVVARLQTDLILRGFAGESFAFANELDGVGIPRVRIVRLSLKSTGG